MIRSQLDTLFPGNEPVLLDGAMGSALRELGWPRDRPSVLANLEHPEQVRDVHEAHLAAGARVLKRPKRADWGGYSGYFADPDGHQLEITTYEV